MQANNTHCLSDLIYRAQAAQQEPELEGLLHAQSSRWHADSLPTQADFIRSVEQWRNIDPIRRAQAAERIVACFQASRLPMPPNSAFELNLSGLHIEYLPDCIDQLSHLRSLNLEKCSLKQLPKAIGTLSQLGNINLQNNQLQSILELEGCKSLQKIDASFNELRTLPKYLLALPATCEVSLLANPVPQGAISLYQHCRNQSQGAQLDIQPKQIQPRSLEQEWSEWRNLAGLANDSADSLKQLKATGVSTHAQSQLALQLAQLHDCMLMTHMPALTIEKVNQLLNNIRWQPLLATIFFKGVGNSTTFNRGGHEVLLLSLENHWQTAECHANLLNQDKLHEMGLAEFRTGILMRHINQNHHNSKVLEDFSVQTLAYLAHLSVPLNLHLQLDAAHNKAITKALTQEQVQKAAHAIRTAEQNPALINAHFAKWTTVWDKSNALLDELYLPGR